MIARGSSPRRVLRLPCAARGLEAILHAVCDHDGWDAEIGVRIGADGRSFLAITRQPTTKKETER